MALAKNIQKSYELTKEADFTIGGLQVRNLIFLLIKDYMAWNILVYHDATIGNLMQDSILSKIFSLISATLALGLSDWLEMATAWKSQLKYLIPS